MNRAQKTKNFMQLEAKRVPAEPAGIKFQLADVWDRLRLAPGKSYSVAARQADSSDKQPNEREA